MFLSLVCSLLDQCQPSSLLGSSRVAPKNKRCPPLHVIFSRHSHAIFTTFNRFRTIIVQKRHLYLYRVGPRPLKTLDLKQAVNVYSRFSSHSEPSRTILYCRPRLRLRLSPSTFHYVQCSKLMSTYQLHQPRLIFAS